MVSFYLYFHSFINPQFFGLGKKEVTLIIWTCQIYQMSTLCGVNDKYKATLVRYRAYASVLQRPFFCMNEHASIIYHISFSSTHTILVCSWKMWARTTFTRSSALLQDWGSTHTHEQGKVWRTHWSLWHFFSTSDSRCPGFPNRLLERTQKRNAALNHVTF